MQIPTREPQIFFLQNYDPYNFIFHKTHHLHRDYLQDKRTGQNGFFTPGLAMVKDRSPKGVGLLPWPTQVKKSHFGQSFVIYQAYTESYLIKTLKFNRFLIVCLLQCGKRLSICLIYRIMIMRDNVKTRAAQLEKFEIVMKVKVYLHSDFSN